MEQRMKKCYVTGKEITVAEALRAHKTILAMDGELDGEFSTVLTELYDLIRCAGDEEQFYTEQDREESNGQLEDFHVGGVVICGEKVAEAIKYYMEKGFPWEQE